MDEDVVIEAKEKEPIRGINEGPDVNCDICLLLESTKAIYNKCYSSYTYWKIPRLLYNSRVLKSY